MAAACWPSPTLDLRPSAHGAGAALDLRQPRCRRDHQRPLFEGPAAQNPGGGCHWAGGNGRGRARVDAALHITGAYAYDLFEADFTAILVMDDPQRTLLRSAFIAERGRRVTEEQYAERFEIAAHPVLREAISTESTLLIENVAEHPLTRDDRRAQCLGVTTCLIVPCSRDRVEECGSRLRLRGAPTGAIRLAETLAQQAAVAATTRPCSAPWRRPAGWKPPSTPSPTRSASFSCRHAAGHQAADRLLDTNVERTARQTLRPVPRWRRRATSSRSATERLGGARLKLSVPGSTRSPPPAFDSGGLHGVVGIGTSPPSGRCRLGSTTGAWRAGAAWGGSQPERADGRVGM